MPLMLHHLSDSDQHGQEFRRCGYLHIRSSGFCLLVLTYLSRLVLERCVYNLGHSGFGEGEALLCFLLLPLSTHCVHLRRNFIPHLQ